MHLPGEFMYFLLPKLFGGPSYRMSLVMYSTVFCPRSIITDIIKNSKNSLISADYPRLIANGLDRFKSKQPMDAL